MNETPIIETEVALVKLNKDLKKAAATMTVGQARFLVDDYYAMQEQRMRAGGQVRAMKEEPHEILEHLGSNSTLLERQIATALAVFAEAQHMGKWAMGVQGIGPILAAALIAFVDMEPWVCAVSKSDPKEKGCNPREPHGRQCKRIRLETAGHIYSFAGLNPESKWEKGQKRPWNARLKVVAWKIGESFVKVKSNPASVYGKLYEERKAYEAAKNEAGDYKEQAAAIVKARPGHAQVKIYKAGKLPPGHLHARAKRYAVKIFLSHWFEEAYRSRWGKVPPAPFPIAILGHGHPIQPEVEFTEV